MKQIILPLALLFSFAIPVEGQSNNKQKAPTTSFEYEDECGNPEVESMIWFVVEGTVIEVLAGDTIIVQTKNNERKFVNLVAVDAGERQNAAHNLLSKLVLNQPVRVAVNPSTIEFNIVAGVVELQGKDVNRALLESGVVKYRKPEPYSMSAYTSCVYRIVERKAREAKKGLWQNASP